jgi:hypothetical protein
MREGRKYAAEFIGTSALGFTFWPPLQARCLPSSVVGAFEKTVVRFLFMA